MNDNLKFTLDLILVIGNIVLTGAISDGLISDPNHLKIAGLVLSALIVLKHVLASPDPVAVVQSLATADEPTLPPPLASGTPVEQTTVLKATAK